jgi:hypothetical protein
VEGVGFLTSGRQGNFPTLLHGALGLGSLQLLQNPMPSIVKMLDTSTR